ncbi:MAG: hypothetical protein HRU11_01905 [Parvularculaceae bacterium]|nr:hypothetical protein [Parvularculaceae bacterium]
MKTLFTTIAVAGSALLASAHAGLMVNIEEVGSDVVLSVSGSFNPVGAGGVSVTGSRPSDTRIRAGFSSDLIQFTDNTFAYEQFSITGPADFALDAVAVQTINPGVESFNFRLNPTASLLWVPIDYSGSELTENIVFSATDLVALNLAAGTYNYSLMNGETVTLIIGDAVAPVPVPAAAMLFAPLAAGMLRRRKR